MDGEVARTLAELERKLQELELALATASREQAPTSSAPPVGGVPSAAGAPPAGSAPPAGDHSQPTSGARLVDENLEGAATTSAGGPQLTPPATPASTSSQATPASTPSQATPAPGSQAMPTADPQATPIFTPPATPGSTSTTPIPDPPATPVSPPSPADDSIELAELSRFRDRLEQMTRELVADYERVIRLRRSGHGQPPDEAV